MTIILTIILIEIDITANLISIFNFTKILSCFYIRRPDCKMISLENKVHPLKRLFEKYHFNGIFTGENDFQ